jgi:hypothetical protein
MQNVSLFIAHALRLVLLHDGFEGPVRWKENCAEAIQQLNSVGVTSYTDKSGAPVLRWYKIFREQMFPNPLMAKTSYGPPILINNPELVAQAQEFGNKHIGDLKAEVLRDHILSVLLPKLRDKKRAAVPSGPEREKITVDSILEFYGFALCVIAQ